MKKIIVLYSFMMLFSQLLHAQSAVTYTIKPLKVDGRINLDITFEFTGKDSGHTMINLPLDRYGTRKIYEAVAEIRVENGQAKTVFGKPYLREIIHRPQARLKVHYTISYPAEMAETSSFSPIMEEEVFHFFGPQWMVKIVDDEGLHHYEIKFENLPEGWVAFSNISAFPYKTTATQDEISGFIAGGRYDAYTFTVNDKPVHLYLSYHFRGQKLEEDIISLLKFQRDYFEDDGNEFFLISLTNRDGLFAGTALKNSFICLLSGDAKKYRVLDLIAHETFHNWLPKQMSLETNDDIPIDFYRSEWLHEGFTVYAGWLMLLQKKAIRREEFVQLLNNYLYDYIENPVTNITFEEMKEVVENEPFMNYHETISYKKGAFLAYQWDNQIREKFEDKTVLDLLKAGVQLAAKNEGILSFANFYQLCEQYGIKPRADFEKYIIDGETLLLTEGWLNEHFNLVIAEDDFYDKGFTTEKAENGDEERINSVVAGSNAYKAGLRPGMELVEVLDKGKKGGQMALKVKEGGELTTIRFSPYLKKAYQKFEEKNTADKDLD